MHIDEISRELGVSEYTVLHHWKDLCGRWGKRGIRLVKCGKGTTANYGIIENGAVTARFEYKGD